MSVKYKNPDILTIDTVNNLFSLAIPDNQLVQTQGYSSESIGSNLYRYDVGSSATIDGGFVLPGVGGTLSFSGTTFNGVAGTGRFIAVDQTKVNAEQFGAIGDGLTDSSNAIELAAAAAVANDYALVHLGAGTFICIDVSLPGTGLRGESATATVCKAGSGASYVFRLGYIPEVANTTYGWDSKVIADLCIDGNLKASDGLVWGQDTNPHTSIAWTIRNVTLRGCSKSLYKPYGNFGNTFDNLQIRSCDYGMFAKGNASPAYQCGSDTWRGGEINRCAIAAMYYDGSTETGLQSGGLSVFNTVIEGNPGFGIVVKGFRDRTPPVLISSMWQEANCTSGTVSLDGSSLAPKVLRFENTYFKVDNCSITSMTMVNSNGVVDYCKLPERQDWATAAKLDVDADSYLRVTNSRITNLMQADVTVESLATSIYRDGIDVVPVGNVSPIMRTLPRKGVMYSPPRGGFLMSSDHFDQVGAVAWGSYNSTPVNDGLLKATCAELVIPDAASAQTYSPALFKYTVDTTMLDDYFVVTGAVKVVGADPSTTGVQINITGDNGQHEHYEVFAKQDEWVTVASIAKGQDTTSGGASPGGAAGLYVYNTSVSGDGAADLTIRLADWQCIRFPNLSDALEFFNSGMFVDQATTSSALGGTFTPTLKFGGNSVGMSGTFNGEYNRINNLIYYHTDITLTSKGSSTGQAIINDLPFTVKPGKYYPGIFVMNVNGGTITTPLLAYADSGTKNVELKYQGATSTGNADDTFFTNTTRIWVTGWYETNE